MKVESEIWQVRIQGQVYETDGETLKKWVGEGMLQPTDHVKKGSLNWIEAGRAPLLRPVFSGEKIILPPPPEATDAPLPPPPLLAPAHAPALASAQIASLMQEHGIAPVSNVADIPLPASNACHFHPQLEPKFICRICSTLFCRECPNFVGASKVPLCKLCGDLCKPLDQVKERKAQQQFQSSGFGFQDFRNALRYPFQNKTGLFFGAAFYGFLLLAGFRGRILASAVLFGCISVVINKVAYGKMDRNFLPDLSEFSMWDDVIMPALLGIGVGIVTLGPTILLVVALLFGVFGGAGETPTPLAQGQPVQQEEQLTQEDMDALVRGDDPERDAETAKKLEKLRPTYQIAQEAKKSEESQAQTFGMLTQFMGGPLLVVLLLLAALAWAVFYYPMALAVAGYTEDFASVVNPLIGLDTIRRMGLNYVKAFLMYAGVQLVGLVLSLVVGLVTAPFQMPFVGNLPATFLDGMITFYTSLVIACILGLALFKSADKLGLNFE